jgi:hypothetical protein
LNTKQTKETKNSLKRLEMKQTPDFIDKKVGKVQPTDMSDIHGAQQEEVLRRQAEYFANPSVATAWDDGFFDRMRQRLADATSP